MLATIMQKLFLNLKSGAAGIMCTNVTKNKQSNNIKNVILVDVPPNKQTWY